MATAVHVAGAALVKVGTGISDALETLGYSINGVEIDFQDYFLDVHGDQNGGEHGPPIDVIAMGEIAIVRMSLSKFDSAVADKVVVRTKGGTAGTPVSAGTLMFDGSKTYRLLIHSTLTPFNFVRAFPRGKIAINKGTKNSVLTMEWECHKNDSGVLYNSTTS